VSMAVPSCNEVESEITVFGVEGYRERRYSVHAASGGFLPGSEWERRRHYESSIAWVRIGGGGRRAVTIGRRD